MADLWRVEAITKAHDRADFSCGTAALDEYLRKYARQNDQRGLGRTFVATRPGEKQVLGYYTLRSGIIELPHLPESKRKHLPQYPVPVVHLGRLAVDSSVRGRGLGAHLLIDALRRAWVVSAQLGIHAVEVIAKNEEAKRFYAHFGFETLEDDELHLYLPIRVIEKLFQGG